MDTRAVRYDSDDSAPVSLPGFLGAVPSIVSPGDTFALDESLTDDEYGYLLDDSRFSSGSADDLAHAETADLTADALRTWLDDRGIPRDGATTKAALRAIAGENARLYPSPPSAAAPTPDEGMVGPAALAAADADQSTDDAPEGES